MRDAMGSVVLLVIIVLFIVVSLGYMAFNVNYTKAFRMKNKIISVYEQYDGNCTSAKCKEEIKSFAKSIGYNIGNMNCPSGFKSVESLYCEKKTEVVTEKDNSSITEIKNKKDKKNGTDIYTRKYYTIITKINIELPIISKVFDFKLFYISGDTKAFEF